MLRHSNAHASTSHIDPSISSRLRRYPFVNQHSDDSLSAPVSKTTKLISTQQLPTPISENRRATGEKSKQFLIRRVQATIEVPVKEECEEKTILDQAQSFSLGPSLSLGPASTIPDRPPTSTIASKTSKPVGGLSKAAHVPSKPTSATSKPAPGRNKPISVGNKPKLVSKSAPGLSKSTTRPSKPTLSGTDNKLLSHPTTSTPASSRPARKARTKRQYIEIDEVDEDEVSELSGSGSDANVEKEDDPSEDDDELMMGAEVRCLSWCWAYRDNNISYQENRREVYGTKRIVAASSMTAVSSAPPKKRKLAPSTTALTASVGKKPPAHG